MRNTSEQGRARLRAITATAASLRSESDLAAPARGVVTGRFARRMLRQAGLRRRGVTAVSTLLARVVHAPA